MHGWILAISCHVLRSVLAGVRATCHYIFQAFVTLKLWISLISHIMASSARIVVDRHTHRTTTVTLAVHVLGIQMNGLNGGTPVLFMYTKYIMILVQTCLFQFLDTSNIIGL